VVGKENSGKTIGIERSADGTGWQSIGNVLADNKDSVHVCFFKDAVPLPNDNFYRLKMDETYSTVQKISNSDTWNGNMLKWLLVGFIAFFAFSQGAVIWVFISEIFPNCVR
jgi:hypothetical protein